MPLDVMKVPKDVLLEAILFGMMVNLENMELEVINVFKLSIFLMKIIQFIIEERKEWCIQLIHIKLDYFIAKIIA